MALFPEINIEQTKENVHQLLSEYRKMARLADNENVPKITATYYFEARQLKDNDSRNTGKRFKEVAENELLKIANAMNKLNAYNRQMLYDRYIGKTKMTDQQILLKLNVSESTFYRELERTLIEFAEAYENGRLLIEVQQENEQMP